MRGAVFYKGAWLMPGSRSRELFDQGRIKELDHHEKQLTAAAKARGEIL